MFLAEAHEVRAASHGTVVVDDLADHASWIEALAINASTGRRVTEGRAQRPFQLIAA